MKKFSIIISLAALFTSFHVFSAGQEKPTPTLSENDDELSVLSATGSQLSSAHETYIRSLMKQLNLKEDLVLVQPSAELKEISPQFHYEAIFIPEYNVLCIDQDWLDQLSESEKLFFVGKSLIKIKNYHHFNEYVQKLEFRQSLFTLAACAVGIFTFWKLSNKAENKSWYNRWYGKWPLSIGAGILFKGLSRYPFVKWAKKDETALLYANAKETAETFKCLEGGLSLYNRLQTELAPYSKTFYWSDYYQAVEKLIPYLQSLKETAK